MQAIHLVAGLAVAAIVSTAIPISDAAWAGELEASFGGCHLSGFSAGCTWKPSNCRKPDAPNTFVFNRADFNQAVDEYNAYLQEVAYYKRCIVGEAKLDTSTNFPNIVVQSVDDETRRIDREADDARDAIELQRPLR